jgi:serine/threonine-protein kinase
MGVVYEASDPNLGRTVALKTIFANNIGTNPEEVAQRFKNEARAAGGLSHSNIVTVFDAGEHDGLLYIAMEFLEGQTLEQFLTQRRTMAPERAIDIVRQICAALDYAHAKGIVHRDIKPANVMLAPNGSVKITDFGIARTAEAITMTGQVMGTPHYMSPEQVRGRPVDGRSDLFSVAVMLYEMVTGERPFEGQSITTIMYKIVHEQPTPPRALDASIPAGLSVVIERALSKSPEERYQTGAALVGALENYKSVDATIRNATAETVSYRPGTVVDPAPTQLVAPPTGTLQPAPPAEKKRGHGTRWAIAGIAIGLAFIVYGRFNKSNHPEPANNQATTTSPLPVTQAPAPPVPPSPGESTNVGHPEAEQKSSTAPVVQKRAADTSKSTATMKVNSNIPGASILLDGTPTNKTTPAEIKIPRGEHSVTVRLEGFHPATAKFKVKGGEEFEFSPELNVITGVVPNISIPKIDVGKLTEQQNKQLRSAEFWQKWSQGIAASTGGGVGPAELSIMVHTTPNGAHILLNGNDTGQVSPAIIPISPGTYRVSAQLEGYEPADKETTVKPGHPAMVNLHLKQAKSNGEDK